MTVVEVIYLVAATLWIFVVVAALCIGIRCMAKVRARRRSINRLIDGVRLPLQLGSAAVLLTATAGKRALVLQRLIGDLPDVRTALPTRRRG